MAKASGEKAARRSGSLMRLGSVRDVVLARVPLADHRTLGYTCKALRRLVYSDDFAKLRKTVGCEESGLLLLARSTFDESDEDEPIPVGRRKQFMCLTHNLESLGYTPPDLDPLNLGEFTTALSADGRLVVCGDSNFDRKVLIYDTREHLWIRDSRYPASLPVVMYGNCTAFLDNTLVVTAGGTQGPNQPWAFAWNEQLRMWEHLPPLPTAVSNPSYGVIGSRLFVVGGYTKDITHPEHYGGVVAPGNFYRMSDYSARLQIFDMATRSWSLGPPLDVLRDRLEKPTSAAVYDGRLYVFCQRVIFSGTDDEIRAHLSHVYCYDPRSNSWSELPPVPVGSNNALAACVHAGRLVVVSNFTTIMPPAAYHSYWDDRTETWKEQPLLHDDVRAWPAGWLESLVSVPLRIR